MTGGEWCLDDGGARMTSASATPATSSHAVATADSPSTGERHTLLPRLSPATDAVLFDDFRLLQASSSLACTDADVAAFIRQRLAAIALRLANAGRLCLQEHQLRAVRQAAFDQYARSLEVVQASAAGLDALSDAGIALVVTKGPGIALSCHNPLERPFGDLDVIVHPNDFRHAVSVLSDCGYGADPATLPPWRWFDTTCQEAVNLHSNDGGSIDVHHHVPPWLWARYIRPKGLIADAHDVSFCGYHLPLVSPNHNLLISSLHIVSDRNRPGETLMAWRDLLVLASTCDPGEVLALSDGYKLTGWLRWIMSQLPPDVRPEGLWSALSHSRRPVAHRVRLFLLSPPAVGSRHMIGQAFRLPARNAVCYLAGMVFPSRHFLASHSPNTRPRYRTWWRTSLKGMLRPRAPHGAKG